MDAQEKGDTEEVKELNQRTTLCSHVLQLSTVSATPGADVT
jgi:hypothetical protein